MRYSLPRRAENVMRYSLPRRAENVMRHSLSRCIHGMRGSLSRNKCAMDRGLKLNEQEKGEGDLADPDRQFPGKKVVSSQGHKTLLDLGNVIGFCFLVRQGLLQKQTNPYKDCLQCSTNEKSIFADFHCLGNMAGLPPPGSSRGED